MGHSWGLVPLTGSEAAGVHYDQVHSLAGAWVPPDWTASGGTDYFHWSYVDALSMAQDVLPVGEGRNPDTSPSFESHVFARQGDFLASLDDTNVLDPVGIPATIHPLSNHNLIAQDSPSNLPALNEMRRRIFDD